MTTPIQAAMEGALDGLRLLEHPFYTRWQNGELSPGELKEYAEQYRHIEAALPAFLQSILAQMPGEAGAAFIRRNLDDEAGEPTHLELFEGFAAAAGAESAVEATPATAELLRSQAATLDRGPGAAIAAFAAYEMQSPDVARTKGETLRSCYGYAKSDTTFWDVHADLDTEHAAWAMEALDECGATADEVEHGARTGAMAWWRFLDERNAMAAAG